MKEKKCPGLTQKRLAKIERALEQWVKWGWRYKVQKWYITWGTKERLTWLIKQKFMRFLRR